MEHRLGEPRAELQVLGLGGQRFAGKLDYSLEVRGLTVPRQLAERSFAFLAARVLDLVEDRSVTEIRPAGVFAFDRIKQVVAERHDRASRSGDTGGRGREFDLADLQQWHVFAVHREYSLTERNRHSIGLLPLGGAPEPDIVVGVF